MDSSNSISKDKYFMNAIAFRLRVKKKKDGLWNAKCPINGCDDKNNKMRFFFVARKDHVLCYCHDCGYSVHLKTFIKDKFPELLDEYKFWGFSAKKQQAKTEEIKEKLNGIKSEPQPTSPSSISIKDLHSLTIPLNQLSITHPARIYVERRQIPFGLVRYTKDFYECTQSLNLDRGYQKTYKKYRIPGLVIPFYDNKKKEIKILQVRFFDNKVKPKYLTIKLDEEEPKVYNQHNVDINQRIYVLEGPIDSMFCGNAVGMAGSDVQLNYKDQVWVWDNEPDNENINRKIMKKIQEGEKIVIWKPKDNFKDINEGIMSGEILMEKIEELLRDRTVCGLKARLRFAKFRR